MDGFTNEQIQHLAHYILDEYGPDLTGNRLTDCVLLVLEDIAGIELTNKIYCARGGMENRIKDQQLYLFADRTSCHRWWPNQFRQLLSGLAYTLFEGMRRLALSGSVLSNASPNRIRLTLLRIGAVVIRNTRRIRLLMSSSYPHHDPFRQVAWRLNSS